MSPEVKYISNVCVMGKKLLLNLSANVLAALIYNFTCGIEKIEKFNGNREKTKHILET